MTGAKANSNFTLLVDSPAEPAEPRYQTYRRAWLENPASFTLSDFPLHLDVEATNRCNLRCVFCDKTAALEGFGTGDMDFERFAAILDEAGEHGLCGLKLSYRGEPLLHPRLPEMVALAKRRGVLDVYFNTNGMLLTRDKALALMDAGLDRISVSVDGTDAAAFEAMRVGASHARIAANIDRLLELREQRGHRGLRVRVQTVRLPGLDLEAYAAQWRGRCDEVGVVDMKDGEVRATGLARADWACPQLWQRLTIDCTGMVLPCNNDDRQIMPLGRAPERSVLECWRDEGLMRARELHRVGLSYQVAACDGCPWRTAQIRKVDPEDRP
jgi:MoaA/NifB/PqqE/SkfB family radical SAM enzyme